MWNPVKFVSENIKDVSIFTAYFFVVLYLAFLFFLLVRWTFSSNKKKEFYSSPYNSFKNTWTKKVN